MLHFFRWLKYFIFAWTSEGGFFKKLGFTLYKAEQPLRDTELQEEIE